MRRLLVIFTLLVSLFLPHVLMANGSAIGICEVGNQKVLLGGLTSTTFVQRSYPQCTVTVFNAGTIVPAVIYSDNVNPPTPIPGASFTANANGTWEFYAANGQYDVVISAGLPAPGITPAVTTFSVTVVDPTDTPFNRNACAPKFNPAGTTAGAAILAAVNDLFSVNGGGVVDASCFYGVQSGSVDWFNGHPNIIVKIGNITYSSSVTINVTTGSSIIGIKSASIISPASSSVPSGELIRLQGDHATLDSIHLVGAGQGSGSVVDGRRGVWVGCGVLQTVGCVENYAVIQNSEIENFSSGNGIAGDMKYAKIINNDIHHNTDANLFTQPLSTDNLIQGNSIYNSRYSGIDNVGSRNRIVANTVHDNGGGILDVNSWNGILLNYSNGDPNVGGQDNIVDGNTIYNNQGCGVLVTGQGATPGIVNEPYGSIISNNVTYGHTTLTGSPSGLAHNQWMGGICLEGGESTTITGNTSHDNVFNYVVAATNVGNNTGIVISNNISFNGKTVASIGTTSGVGYYFPASARLDGVGGHSSNDVIFTGNFDRYSAGDCFRTALDGATAANLWTGWTIKDNHMNNCGGWGFNNASPNQWNNFVFKDNTAVTAASGVSTGWNVQGYNSPNNATPSVLNRPFIITQNTNPTTITNLANGTYGQHLIIEVGDSAPTTIGFAAAGPIKGNNGSPMVAANGDFLGCDYDGTNWFCVPNHTQGFAQGATVSVSQGTSKTTAVTANGISGRIVINSANLNAGATATFAFNNSFYSNTDDMYMTIQGGTANSYTIFCNNNGAGVGSCNLTNNSAGNLAESFPVAFSIKKN